MKSIYRIEALTLPVSDVDRAKAFYEKAGFHLDLDTESARRYARGPVHARRVRLLNNVRHRLSRRPSRART